MTTKKIKNYMIVVLFVISGLIALWNEFGSTTEETQSPAIEETMIIYENENVLETSIDAYLDVMGIVRTNELEPEVLKSYLKYNEDGWNGLVDGQTTGTKAGGKWGNYDNQLPEFDQDGNEISYKEFDVNNKISGQSRDAERFVVGSDHSVYYTSDHYDSYMKIIE